MCEHSQTTRVGFTGSKPVPRTIFINASESRISRRFSFSKLLNQHPYQYLVFSDSHLFEVVQGDSESQLEFQFHD